ncbi:MAG: hypothetical protein U0167_16660 [bacterium]
MRSLATRLFPYLAVLAATCGCAQRPTDPANELPVEPGQVPPVPKNLAVDVSQGTVMLTWTVDDPTGVTDYRVYRAPGNDAFSLLASPVATSFDDDQVSPATLYRYRVAARRNGLEGSPSEAVSAEPPTPVLFDAAGSHVVGAGINLLWSRSNDVDFVRYRIYRSPPGGTTVGTSDDLIADITARDTVTLSDAGLVGGSTYTWGILAVNANGFSSPLNRLTRDVLHDPQLSNGGVAPNFGTPATTFVYSCRYRHAGNVAPGFVTVIVDANQIFAMAKVGTGTDWVGGEDYQASVNLAAGGHTYYFQAQALDGSSTRNPAAPFVLGGPAVSP